MATSFPILGKANILDVQYASPISDITTGHWAPSPLYAQINERNVDTSNFIYSSDHPSNDECEVKLAPLINPNRTDFHTVFFTHEKNSAGSQNVDLTVSLFQGASQIAARTYTNIPSSWSGSSFTLTTGEAGTIADYTDLRLRFKANQSQGFFSFFLPIDPTILPPGAAPTGNSTEKNVYRLVFTSGVSAVWQYAMPTNYQSGLSANLYYTMTSASGGNVSWSASVWAMAPGDAADTKISSFDSVNTVTGQVPSGIGWLGKTIIPLTFNDTLAAGDFMQLQITRNYSTASGNANLLALSLDYTKA